jgi:hypothetical protein
MPRLKRYYPNGAVFWSGPSEINGSPIVAIVTGLFTPSANPKTGPMHQTWILDRANHPHEAMLNGLDESICGTCPMRWNADTGKRLCYVNPMTPGQIYRSYLKGKYRNADIDVDGDMWFDLKPLRIGAYGDPAAVPLKVWTNWIDLLKALKIGWTGYTRRWMEPQAEEFKHILMASVFSLEEHQRATSMGWQTYRVLSLGAELPAKSVICPGSAEGDYAKTCRECLMCRGTQSGKDIITYVHGNHGKFFKEEN